MEENMEPTTEKKSNKKKIFTILGVVIGVMLIASAAYIGGRLLNRSGNPSGGNLLNAGGGSGVVLSGMVNITPALELPTTQPEVVGTYVKRQDNSIFLQKFSMDTSGGGVSVSSSAVGAGSSNPSANKGPQQEVVITNKTMIYTDVTQFSSNQNTTIQQVVKQATLDDISPQTMITVWGHKDGNRVIADVILYTTPMTVLK